MAMLEKPIARRYARAVIGLAQEKGALEKVAADLDGLAQLMEDNKELRHALLSPSFRNEQRRAILAGVMDAGDKPHEITRTLVNLLVDKGRVPYIPLIAESFRSEADRILGRVRAEVQSAVPLEKAELEKIQEALKQQVVTRKLGSDVVVRATVNPELLAGVRASLGGLVFDGSLKSHLRRINTELTGA